MIEPPHAQHPLLQRLDDLAAVLRDDPSALGLLALGSVGTETQRLDAWSDLDFFVVVEREAKASYVDDIHWLHRAHPLVWSFRNTVDGHKALMADGVLCEFAVFDPTELPRVPYAPGRWVWRRDRLDAALARPTLPLPARHDVAWLVGEALSNLLIALMRHARGERLAAMRLVQVHALDRVLELAALQSDPGTSVLPADPFNADRRLEARCPELEPALPVWAGGYGNTVKAASSLLAWLQGHHDVPPALAARIETLIQTCEGIAPSHS